MTYIASLCSDPVFPAFAGVSLRVVWAMRSCMCFPRVRGGEPIKFSDRRKYYEFSPRSRG